MLEDRHSSIPLLSTDSDAPGTSHCDVAPSQSRLIIHPGEVERMARQSVRDARRQSAVAIRLALAASVGHGNSWFSVSEVARTLGGAPIEQVSVLASRLNALGVAEVRKTFVQHGQYPRVDARLNLRLLDVRHPLGGISARIRRDIDAYGRTYPWATPLPVLLSVGIRLYGFVTSNGLARFLEPELDRKRSPSAATKPLLCMEQLGILTVVRDGPPPTPFYVAPVDHAL
jgi:hypothetical protein